MQITIVSSPLLSVGPNSYSTSPMENVLPPRTVECANLDACAVARDAYVAETKATGKPAAISVFKAPRSSGRKVNGFDAWSAKTILVNADAAARSKV